MILQLMFCAWSICCFYYVGTMHCEMQFSTDFAIRTEGLTNWKCSDMLHSLSSLLYVRMESGRNMMWYVNIWKSWTPFGLSNAVCKMVSFKRKLKEKILIHMILEILYVFVLQQIDFDNFFVREKGRDLTQSYDKIPFNHRKNSKSNATTLKKKPPPKEKKEEIWLSPMTKAPTPAGMPKGQSDNTNNATKKFDDTAVADRLRTVSWSNNDHPTGVVNLVYGPNLPTPRNSRAIKRTHVWKFVNKFPYIDNKPTATPSGEVIKIDTRKA